MKHTGSEVKASENGPQGVGVRGLLRVDTEGDSHIVDGLDIVGAANIGRDLFAGLNRLGEGDAVDASGCRSGEGGEEGGAELHCCEKCGRVERCEEVCKGRNGLEVYDAEKLDVLLEKTVFGLWRGLALNIDGHFHAGSEDCHLQGTFYMTITLVFRYLTAPGRRWHWSRNLG